MVNKNRALIIKCKRKKHDLVFKPRIIRSNSIKSNDAVILFIIGINIYHTSGLFYSEKKRENKKEVLLNTVIFNVKWFLLHMSILYALKNEMQAIMICTDIIINHAFCYHCIIIKKSVSNFYFLRIFKNHLFKLIRIKCFLFHKILKLKKNVIRL